MDPDVAEWQELAWRDLEAADYNLKGGHVEVAAFLAQQAAEKALNAVHLARSAKVVRVHDLVRLAKDLDACDLLNPMYIFTRYPVSLDVDYAVEDVERAVALPKEMVQWAEATF